ncbi:MAG TPA: cytochrome c oxidase subunit II, partial [Stellaceae bacterium]
MEWVPFWPKDAAVSGHVVDTLYIGELALTFLILGSVYGLMVVFCIRYWRGRRADRGDQIKKTWIWEIGWTSATLAAFLALFVWGANAFVFLYKPPPGDLEIYVVAKQWMWKTQHTGGQREIDELHVPLGKDVR